MALHQISFLRESNTDFDPNPPPVTLPVMYKDDRLALAVYYDTYYSYNLPEPISEIIHSGTFIQTFAYRDQFNQIHAKYTPGATLSSIQLIFVDSPD